MNFKKLEIFGFKSFADKIEINFNGGITGIVGPNGCGKSNVADSIRWVLGEQSAKLLRGTQMMDVIFNGTENRKSLSYCEVSLFFDNTSRIFPLDYDEVVISRKLFRSGESEYCMNRQACRLRDIQDLLRDCGIGREGYSIIGQGRIDEILSAKPEDRRGVFEEACGISKFKVRKIETERKLQRTRENLIRLNDILNEIERQLSPLAEQSEVAKKYLELKEKLKIQEINHYICHYETASSTKKAIEQRLESINQEYSLRLDEYKKATSEYEELFKKLNNIDKEINDLRNSQLSMTVFLEKQAGEYRLLSERVQRLSEQNGLLRADIQKSTEQREKLKEELEGLKAEKDLKLELYQGMQLEADQLSTKYLDIISQIMEGEDAAEESQRKLIEAMSRLSEIKSSLSSLETEKSVLSQRLQDVGKRIIEMEEETSREKAKQQAIESELEALSRKKQGLIEQKNALLVEYNQKLGAQKECQSGIRARENQIASLRTKLNYLNQVKDNFEGYNYSVRALLVAAAKDRALKMKIEGVVARLIQVPQNLEIAIDVALGQAMQNIVTRTQEDAKHLIGYLKQNGLGRVTFLPMDAIQPRRVNGETLRIASGCKGFLGVASDLIRFDKAYYNIITGLLGKTLVCDSLDNAVVLSRKINFSAKIVTLDGDIIHAYGAMTGGSRKSEVSNLLGYDREINEAAAQLEHAEREMGQLKQKLAELENECVEKYSQTEQLQKRIHDVDIEVAKHDEQLQKHISRLREGEKELSVLREESAKIEERIAWIEGQLRAADELEAAISRQRSDAAGIRQEQKEKYDALRRERDKLHEQVTNLKIKLASLYAEIAAMDEKGKGICSQIEELEKDIRAAEGLIGQNLESIRQAEEAMKGISFEVEVQQELEEIKVKLSNLDEFKFKLQSDLGAADRKRQELQAILQKISENRLREENNLMKVDDDLELMRDKIWEEYQITYETAQQYRLEKFNFSASGTDINRLKKQINSLGYVNVNAIEDYKALKARYDELDMQIKDLTKAEEDLKKIIEELTKEMVARFTKGFDDINENFKKVFKELFGGGNARLILDNSETDDPLSAGIEIVAEPPGKKLQNISLLSGGERALTAIAILFAILRMRPMPFCVLDEIEAALDEVNAMRFARYLKEFSRQTQFIVITHRKPTMELADSLYGVTMEEKGVSKLVSVKLSDALASAQ